MNNSNILITGSSATGKSTIAKILKAKGYNSLDADYDAGIAYWENKFSGKEELFPENPPDEWGAEHHWKWKLVKLEDALKMSDKRTFVCGTAENYEKSYSLFDEIIILTASKNALADRLRNRTGNSFGKLPAELSWALNNNDETVSKATIHNHPVIDTTNVSPEEIIEEILRKVS